MGLLRFWPVLYFMPASFCLSQVNFSRHFRPKPLALFINTELISASRLQNCVCNTSCYILTAQNDRKHHSFFLIAQGRILYK